MDTDDAKAHLRHTLFWSAMGLLGLILFFGQYLPAVRDAADTRDLVVRLELRIGELQAERDMLQARIAAVDRGDPHAIQRALREHDIVPAGVTRLVENVPGRQRR
ncbi:MAG: hypothetical protein EXS14_02145 [Planctomycetes bacterium]|nr:hypothetical protein [Planctomycetota bacterium]